MCSTTRAQWYLRDERAAIALFVMLLPWKLHPSRLFFCAVVPMCFPCLGLLYSPSFADVSVNFLITDGKRLCFVIVLVPLSLFTSLVYWLAGEQIVASLLHIYFNQLTVSVALLVLYVSTLLRYMRNPQKPRLYPLVQLFCYIHLCRCMPAYGSATVHAWHEAPDEVQSVNTKQCSVIL